MAESADDVSRFLAQYPPPVRDLALELQRTIVATIPDATETVDVSGRIVGYGFGPGYRDMICSIIPSKTGVKLGVVRGAELPDPDGILEGAGKRHRYVALASVADAKRTALKQLLKAGVAAWKARSQS
jgi:hypothetical protein